MAIYANLQVDQGSTFKTTINVSQAGGGDSLDLTGYLVRAQMRKSYASSASIDFDTLVDDPENGVISIALTAAASAAAKAGRYVYDVEIESPSETVTRVVEGQIEVTPRVTR